MKFMIENLGLLNQAEIEIGDLTILCGENNSGKTYAVYAFYGFWKFFSKNLGEFVSQHKNDFIQEDKTISIEKSKFIDICKHLVSDINKHYKDDLAKVLGGSADNYADTKFKSEFQILDIETIYNQENISLNIYEKDEKIIFDYFNEENIIMTQNKYLLLIYQTISQLICKPKNIEIISVERTGIDMFYNELNLNKNSLLAGLAQADEKTLIRDINNYMKTTMSRYPLPIIDNIETINDRTNITKEKSFISQNENREIVGLLWQIVGGKYIINESGIQFANGAKVKITSGCKSVDIQQTSSSVKSLFLLDLYIKYKAQKGDILIIDEPELNLHPRNQILLARLLVMLVNIGIKVFISTHSDYILREFSSCICLKNVSDENLKNLKEYNKQMQLDANKVRAYQTIKIKDVITTKSVKITQEDGIFMDTFNDIINEQNRTQDKIYEQILKSQS
ncbi:ATP-binding protein [Campylobacter hyointestinalis]|uniref:ATP-binding protein n=1 Tax=Campylobacter hyointestinalis TaxID=198 RepID=A0A562XDS0_CAMHY|nr:AAA family ATPase [Campylobacter hyointestinalis]TWO19836.1 ATP-binding protein [Campylobacter hyointestinalis]